MKYRISHLAESDLAGIWEFVADDNPRAADRLISKFVDAFVLLGEHPDAGVSCDEISRGLRRLPIGNYLIFYFRRRNHVEIVRVLHGARDWPAFMMD